MTEATVNTLTPHGILAIEKVIQWLDSGAKHVTIKNGRVIDVFNMSHAVTVTECGTACCLAGAVVQFEGLDTFPLDGNGKVAAFHSYGTIGVGEQAATFLGLDEGSADLLFMPWGTRINGEYYDSSEFNDPEVASATLKHLLKTGQVVWFIEEE